MPSGGILSMIYIGNYADQEAAAGTTGPYVDVGDVNGNAAEANAGQLIGEVIYGDVLAAVDVTVVGRQDNAGNDTLFGTDDYDAASGAVNGYGSEGTVADGYDYLGESIEYTLPDGTSYGDSVATDVADRGDGIAVDSITYYTADVTVVDPVTGAETVQSKALVPTFQTDTGDIFIYEYAGSDAASFNFDGLNIKSIEFTGIYANNTAVGANFYSETWDIDGATFVPCFVSGTMIETDRGAVDIAELAAGDMVRTLDHGYKSISWAGSRLVNAAQLAENPKLRPIRIKAGALGQNHPASDLLVSRQHRMMVKCNVDTDAMELTEVLMPAKDLLGLPGVALAEDVTEVTYHHIMFDQHEVVFANGTPSESLYSGKFALMALSPEAREEIFTIFPELRTLDHDALPKPARPFVAGKEARNIVALHMQQDTALTTAA